MFSKLMKRKAALQRSVSLNEDKSLQDESLDNSSGGQSDGSRGVLRRERSHDETTGHVKRGSLEINDVPNNPLEGSTSISFQDLASIDRSGSHLTKALIEVGSDGSETTHNVHLSTTPSNTTEVSVGFLRNPDLLMANTSNLKSSQSTLNLRRGLRRLSHQYQYNRPEFIVDAYSDAELKSVFSSHFLREIAVPKPSFQTKFGVEYAECLNSGKSKLNEDQTSIHEGVLFHKNTNRKIKYFYVALFDGHGGFGCALKASNEMFRVVHDCLEDVLDYLVYPKVRDRLSDQINQPHLSAIDKEFIEFDDSIPCPVTIDEIVSGALESAFWAMDQLILNDKTNFLITGGCTAMVSLFILGKLYVANAGDSRAVMFRQGALTDEVESEAPLPSPRKTNLPICKDNQRELIQDKQSNCRIDVVPMSVDLTPTAERQRIQTLVHSKPHLIRNEAQDLIYNRQLFSRILSKDDIGKQMLYQDYFMKNGWSCKIVSEEDVQLRPLITGRKKQCRLLSTIGVARCLGNHNLLAKGTRIKCKDLLSSQPDVKIFDLEKHFLTQQKTPMSTAMKKAAGTSTQLKLIMGSDGLWDVTSNEDMAKLILKHENGKMNSFAEMLVREARGVCMPDGFWEKEGGAIASGDDISVVVIDLKHVFDMLKN